MTDDDRPPTYGELAERVAALTTQNAALKYELKQAEENAVTREAQAIPSKRPKPRLLDKSSADSFARPYDGR